MKHKLLAILLGTSLLATSALSQSIKTGIIITANATGWSAVHLLPGTTVWEVYAPGKSITGKVHADTNFQVNILPGIEYASLTGLQMVAGAPSDTVSLWYNTDENQYELIIYDGTGHVVSHIIVPPGPKGGFVVVANFAQLRMKQGQTYYGDFQSTIFPLGSPTPTPQPTPCPCP